MECAKTGREITSDMERALHDVEDTDEALARGRREKKQRRGEGEGEGGGREGHGSQSQTVFGSLCPGLVHLFQMTGESANPGLQMQFLDFDETCEQLDSGDIQDKLGATFVEKWMRFQRTNFPLLSLVQQSALETLP